LSPGDLAAGHVTFTLNRSKIKDMGNLPPSLAPYFPEPLYPVNYGDYRSYALITAVPPGLSPPNGVISPWGNSRLTDVLISVPPADNSDRRFFVWPLWAKDNSAVNSLSLEDFGTIRIFNGTGKLRNTEIILQSIMDSGLVSPEPPILSFALNVPDEARSGKERNGLDGLWLPRAPILPARDLIPAPYHEDGTISGEALAAAGGRTLYNFKFSPERDGYGKGSVVEFFMHLSQSPPDLYMGRLDVSMGTRELPELWFRKIRPFSFTVHDITRQRGGVTILNNVINPTRGEQVYVDYILKKTGMVTVQVFTLDGTLIKVLHRGNQDEGEYTLSWNGRNGRNRDVARGMYFIRVVAPEIDEIRKVMVVK
jgi:hypothetical protein